jgi:hypothetical protein
VQYLPLKEFQVMLIIFPDLQNCFPKYYNRQREKDFLKEYLPVEDSFERDIQKENNFIIFPDYISKVFVFTLGKPNSKFTPSFRILFYKNKTLSLQSFEKSELNIDGFSFSKQSDVFDIFCEGYGFHKRKSWVDFVFLTNNISNCIKVTFTQIGPYVSLSKYALRRIKDYKILPKKIGYLCLNLWSTENLLEVKKYFYDEKKEKSVVIIAKNVISLGQYDAKENTIEIQFENSNIFHKIKV